MHVEPPEGRIDSVKSFLGHYLMIVLSILTALGLEETLQHLHRAQAGREALERIEHEMRDNLRDVRAMIADDIGRRKPIDEWARRIAVAVKSGMPEEKIRKDLIVDVKDDVIQGPGWPEMRHAAWDVAVANQSAAYIDTARLQSISEFYSEQREFGSVLLTSASMFNATHLSDTLTDLELDEVRPREFLRTLRQASMSLQSTVQNLIYMERMLERATGEKHHPWNVGAGASGSASSASN